MAELFSYQGQQGIVSPQSPFVQAAPVKAPFSKVSELLLTAQKAQLNLKTLESVDLTAQQKALNIEYDTALTQAYLREDQKQSVMYQDWQKSFLEVGTDVIKQREVTQAYLTESQSAFEGVAPEVQAKTITATQAGQQNANTSFLKSEFAYNKEESRNQILGSLPAWLNSTGEEKAAKFTDMQSLAVTKGWTKKEFGEWFVGSAFNTLAQNVDAPAMLRNTEEGLLTLDTIQAQVNELVNLDPNNTAANLQMNNYVAGLRTGITNEVKGNITNNIETLNGEVFNKNNDMALVNNLIGQEDYDNNNRKYMLKATNPTSLSKQAAQARFNQFGSGSPAALITDALEGTEYTKLVTEDVKRQIIDPNANYESLNKAATANKPLYQKVYRASLDFTLNELTSFSKSKDVTNEGLAQRMESINQLSLRAFGSQSKEQIIKLGVAKAMISSGRANALGEAFTTIENQGGNPPLLSASNKEVKSMLENIPPADRFAAQVQMSTLNSLAGISEVEARELTEKAFGYTELPADGLSSSITSSFPKSNLGPRYARPSESDKLRANMHNAENVRMSNSMVELMSSPDMGLQSPETFYYLISNETVVNPFGEETRQQITDITAKTNPRISFDNNVLTVKNDEGDTFRQFLTNDQMKSMVNDSNDIYREANPPSAWDRLNRDFATGTYNFFTELGQGPQDDFNTQRALDGFINNLNFLADAIANPQQPFTQPTNNQDSVRDATNFKKRRSSSAKDWYQQ
tara:strand:- start:6878 stop:9115 length:2238 start_codon:yes stop_codon:yes gene_type:complete